MKIKQSTLNKIIKESIEATISSRKDTTTINKQELKQFTVGFKNACNAFLNALNQYKEFLNGTEEDSANNIPETEGFLSNLRWFNMYNDNEEDYLQETIEDFNDTLRNLSIQLNETIEYTEDIINHHCNY